MTIDVTTSDVERWFQAGYSVGVESLPADWRDWRWCPKDQFGTVTRFHFEDILRIFVFDTLGRVAPLRDAMDVLEDQGALAERIHGVMNVGNYAVVATRPDGRVVAVRKDASKILVNEGLPVLRTNPHQRGRRIAGLWLFRHDDAITIWFRTGVVAPAVQIRGDTPWVDIVIAPEARARVASRWRLDDVVHERVKGVRVRYV